MTQEPGSLTGDELFRGMDATVRDFWQFAMTDLRMNNTRGYLAEFLVARALGSTAPRVEWDAYDVLTPEGIRVEVKSSAYLQSWKQETLSRITFGSLTGQLYDEYGRARTSARTFNADVYVFCVQTAQTAEEYQPLNVDQWVFYVVARSVLEERGWRSIGLSSLRRLCESATPYADLPDAVRAAAAATNR